MSKKLSEDQEKFSTLAEDLEKISKEQRPLTEEQLQMSTEILGQYKEQLSVAGIQKFFKVWEADTPEEAEVVEICKAESDLASVLLLLVKNILVVYIDVLPFRPRMVCQGMGIFLGGLYGVIISNKPNFERFNALGKDYLLGRIARDEVLHWGSEAKALEIYEKRELD